MTGPLGCESLFSGFVNDCKQAVGSTSLKNIPNKNIISNNKRFKKSRWTSLSETERRKRFK